MECIGQRQVGHRLENGEPFVATWHDVTNLIISTESHTCANIEVRHARNESSMIMDRCGTRTSVTLHKFAKVPWLKLRRDNSVLDSDLRIAAVNTKPRIMFFRQERTSERMRKQIVDLLVQVAKGIREMIMDILQQRISERIVVDLKFL